MLEIIPELNEEQEAFIAEHFDSAFYNCVCSIVDCSGILCDHCPLQGAKSTQIKFIPGKEKE